MIEAMKQALEALQGSGYYDTTQQREAITAIKEAIREHAMYEVQRLGQEIEQEPVALVIDGVLVKSAIPEKFTGHLYTHPPQRTWVGLTDAERFEVADHSDCFEDVVDAVEAKLKEKNNG